MRVALVSNIASPYRFPTWDALTQRVGKLHILLCAEKDPNRVWEIKALSCFAFDVKILPGWRWYISKRDWGIYWNPTLVKELRAVRPTHIIVTGFETPSYLTAILYARRNRIPLTIWWGSHAMSSRSRRGPVAWIRRNVLRLADSYVTYGTLSTQYLKAMGIPEERIVTGINTVDVARIRSLVDQYREELQCMSPSPVRFLYVGQFVKRKGVMELLKAFVSLPAEKVQLTLVGYGPLERQLKGFSLQHNLSNVVFAGATKTLDETIRYYASADVLVMPSLIEVWGLVVNEALAAGLYVISSKYAGATTDLIIKAPDDVGQAIDPFDRQSIIQILENTIGRIIHGEIDRRTIARWGSLHTPEQYADAVYNAVQLAKTRTTF